VRYIHEVSSDESLAGLRVLSFVRPCYQVEVTLLDHRLTKIQILSNKNSRYGRKAAGVVPLIIEQQKAGVDGISGATRCSTGLKRAVSDALLKALPVAH
jgi:NosR/NirI family nitrous oxide reductase transcriptional regulator